METQTFTEKINEGPASLKVSNEIGSITVVPSIDNNRNIHIEVKSREMEITISNVDNHVTVRAECEETWRHPIESIKAIFSRKHPEAHLTIQVPADSTVQAKMVTGELSINGIEGMVNGRVVTGSAKLANLSGPVSVKTVTGTLTYNGQLSDETYHFKTVTGSVRLNLRHLPNTQLDARTDVGSIHCGFGKGTAVTRQNFIGSRLYDILGGGQGHLKIRVATGSIHLNHIVEKQNKSTPDGLQTAPVREKEGDLIS